MQRAIGIICRGRLDGHHPRAGRERRRGQRDAAGEPAAADGGEHHVECRHIGVQFERGGPLTGDDARVVVRRHKDGAGFICHAFERGFAVCLSGFTPDDMGAVAGDRLAFDLRGIARHDNMRRDMAQLGRQC